MKSLPVYSLRDFRKFSQQDAFYASPLKIHVRNHDFTNKPHKHDFFVFALFISGKGTHEIDFKKYTVQPGSLFLMRPGQMHNWDLSPDCDGYIFFHTRNFYDEGFTLERLNDYPFYASLYSSPLILLKGKPYAAIRGFLKEITEEYQKNERLKHQKLHALVNLVYIEVTRLHKFAEEPGKESYLNKLKTFEDLIDRHFKELKSARDYAALMHISEKHLNRISKTTLRKTSTELISERVILEAKRMLIHAGLNVTEIAYKLGFKDNSYFNRFFKKHCGETPLGFLNKYKNE